VIYSYKHRQHQKSSNFGSYPFKPFELFCFVFFLKLLNDCIKRHLNIKDSPYPLWCPFENKLIVQDHQQETDSLEIKKVVIASGCYYHHHHHINQCSSYSVFSDRRVKEDRQHNFCYESYYDSISFHYVW
jgi:hypothetical protein